MTCIARVALLTHSIRQHLDSSCYCYTRSRLKYNSFLDALPLSNHSYKVHKPASFLNWRVFYCKIHNISK